MTADAPPVAADAPPVVSSPELPPVVIRPLRRRDIPGAVELRRQLWADEVATPESMAWGIARTEPRERVRRWVASARGDVVGWAIAGRASWSTDRVAYAYFGVRSGWRRHGIGGALFGTIERHLASLAPDRTLSATERGDDGSRFLADRGFRHTRDDQAWSVDPRAIPLAGLPSRLAAASAAGFRIAPIRDLLGRPEALYRLHVALQGDLPSDVPVAEPFPSWRIRELEHPLFAPDASFCVLAGDEPVALTWIMLDAAGHRARHGMTGTLSAFRHRGLGRLVKLASIGWLAEHGVTALYTDNDTQNHDMLALNEHLGFRPLTVFELWVRDSTSP